MKDSTNTWHLLHLAMAASVASAGADLLFASRDSCGFLLQDTTEESPALRPEVSVESYFTGSISGENRVEIFKDSTSKSSHLAVLNHSHFDYEIHLSTLQ